MFRKKSCIFALRFEELCNMMEAKYQVDHVESGLPRWLIEMAFACMLVQGVINWGPLMSWVEDNASLLQAIVQTVGPVVMYVALMIGMRSLYRPYQAWWWAMIVLNVLGFFPLTISAIPVEVGLALAVSLLFVYIPFGFLLAFSYRGRLRSVGLWMALYILITIIVPVFSFLLIGPLEGLDNLALEIPTVGVNFIYAWVLRRVLV